MVGVDDRSLLNFGRCSGNVYLYNFCNGLAADRALSIAPHDHLGADVAHAYVLAGFA